MPREQRAAHPHAFAEQGDFNEQLYNALKQSPWWMISIAIHVIVFLIASLLMQQDAQKEPPKQVAITAENFDDLDDEEEEEEEQEEIEEEEIEELDPVIKEEMSDHVETDNELPFQESLGEDGISDAPFTGPSNNGLIGLGGGAGGAFRGRGGGRDTGRRGGKRARGAVEDALKWLAAHQSPSGGWEAAGFNKWCDYKPVAQGPEGLGKALYDPGVTGLALCAFLGAGYTNRGKHDFAKVVAKGLRYLKNVQDAEGCFGARTSQHFIYNHATAALAMVEAYGMTESPIFKASAQKALDFIALSRNPYFAWRYGVKPGDNDSSVTGWMMMALKSAKLINEDAVARGKKPQLIIDEEAFDGIRTWIDKMTDPDYGRTGYAQRGGAPARPQGLIDKFPGDKSESMTGVGILARIFIGEGPRKSDIIKKGAKLCAALPPKWDPEDGSIDMYYWYYATLAMYQVGGNGWKVWNEGLKTGVVDSQRKDTDYCMYKGSWDPIGPWGPDGGRVYSTAILALCLEVYYRYDKVFGT
jgi:hypothetical protein